MSSAKPQICKALISAIARIIAIRRSASFGVKRPSMTCHKSQDDQMNLDLAENAFADQSFEI
ncbi:MAG: hypothetical protein WCF79_08235, partial [Rhodomicrobium sp.]